MYVTGVVIMNSSDVNWREEYLKRFNKEGLVTPEVFSNFSRTDLLRFVTELVKHGLVHYNTTEGSVETNKLPSYRYAIDQMFPDIGKITTVDLRTDNHKMLYDLVTPHIKSVDKTYLTTQDEFVTFFLKHVEHTNPYDKPADDGYTVDMAYMLRNITLNLYASGRQGCTTDVIQSHMKEYISSNLNCVFMYETKPIDFGIGDHTGKYFNTLLSGNHPTDRMFDDYQYEVYSVFRRLQTKIDKLRFSNPGTPQNEVDESIRLRVSAVMDVMDVNQIEGSLDTIFKLSLRVVFDMHDIDEDDIQRYTFLHGLYETLVVSNTEVSNE